MPFVSGHKHDLFLSYAHAETPWVNAFRKALCDEFEIRTGQKLAIWQDSRNLRVGQKWEGEIEEGIRTAGAFLAVVSPSYLTSPWCRDERKVALERKLDALKVESFYRFLKIIKAPGPGKAHEELLAEIEHFSFFNEADEYEIPEGSSEFTAAIRALTRQIREILALMRNKCQELYLAPGAIDAKDDREEVKRELTDRGFTVKPDILLDDTFGKDPVRRAMENASAVMFVLGRENDAFTGTQAEVAHSLGKRILFWVRPGEGKEAMLARVEEWRSAESEVLGGLSIRQMLPLLLANLAPAPAAPPVTQHSGTPRVYLHYDSSLPEEARMAGRIAELVRERKFEVQRNGPDGEHEQLMRTANGVLLFRAAQPIPDQWLSHNTMELAMAGQIYGRQPDFSPRALLVTNPGRIQARAASVPIYTYAEPFAPETLTPFFESLDRTRA